MLRHALLAFAIIGLWYGGVSCDDDKKSSSSGTTFKQIERLARPAINEGLITTNDFLIAFNEIPPSQDMGAGAAPVRNEALAFLAALGNSAQRQSDIASAFLPDVMRIDTAVASPVGTGAYANSARSIGALGVVQPIAGRKIEDDVIDITLSVLTNGAITTDNVSYDGVTGNEAQTPGAHSLLHGQTVANGTATFPFMPAPN